MAAAPLLGAEGSEIEADSSRPPPKVPAVAHLLQESLTDCFFHGTPDTIKQE